MSILQKLRRVPRALKFAMAAFLSDVNKQTLDWVVSYSENSPIDHPVDERIVNALSKLWAALGYSGELALANALRDKPLTTLLKAIQYLNAQDAGTAPTLSVVHAPDGDPDSPFPQTTTTLTITPHVGFDVVVQVSLDPTFSTGVLTSSITAQDNVSTVYIAIDTQAFFPGTYYFRAYASQHPTLYSNVVSYGVV